MEVVQIVGIGLISLVIIIILRQYKPEFTIYISLAAGAIILFLVIDQLAGVVNLLANLARTTSINSEFITILLKITGIAILTEFGVSICKDAGETAVANKIDFGGKIIIVSISIPIITALLEMVVRVLP
ncbi:MAG: stage III sporulation protein AD [Oscillospiraceae bacterium]|nr:stage III sporulation protein AD [Oscillospiraceae bacterium]